MIARSVLSSTLTFSMRQKYGDGPAGTGICAISNEASEPTV
jgi:hypothetical protein